jgi:hypothetical protein
MLASAIMTLLMFQIAILGSQAHERLWRMAAEWKHRELTRGVPSIMRRRQK